MTELETDSSNPSEPDPEPSGPPNCFISYSHDSDAHKDWVRQLAEDLRQNGIAVVLDQWHLQPGQDALRFMETSIREADSVLLICTPEYRTKSNLRSGGVGWEASVITSELYHLNDRVKFIPVLRMGDDELALLPSYLSSKVYIDARIDAEYRRRAEDIVRAVLGRPRHVPPPVGPRPELPPTAVHSSLRLIDLEKKATAIDNAGTSAGSLIRIAIYHWIPLAANMLPQIDDSLAAMWQQGVRRHQPQVNDSLTYNVDLPFSLHEAVPRSGFRMTGRINSRGFAQHILDLPGAFVATLPQTLEELIPIVQASVNELLINVLPRAVRNKLAVLKEGIVSMRQFPTAPFGARIEQPGLEFLEQNCFTAVVVGADIGPFGTVGFNIGCLNMEVPAFAGAFACMDEKRESLCYFSPILSPEEAQDFDGIIYAYCALHTFNRFVTRTIEILKDTREHVIPLRRRLALALQGDTNEHLSMLRQMHRYFTYIDIKLPVIQKVRNHISEARASAQFSSNLSAFGGSGAKLTSQLVALLSTGNPMLNPLLLTKILDDDLQRLHSLYDEDEREIQVLSSECAEVLQGSLLSEEVDVSTRRLEAAQATLELDRSAKNRSNALKALTVLLSIGTGLLVADALAVPAGSFGAGKIGFALAVTAAAWIFVTTYISRQSSVYRLVVPLDTRVDPRRLGDYVQTRTSQRKEGKGGRRKLTWRKRFHAVTTHGGPLADRFMPRRAPPEPTVDPYSSNVCWVWTFDVTLDYEKDGLVHSVTFETEHGKERFSTLELVVQFLQELKNHQIESTTTGRAIFPDVVLSLEIGLHRELWALPRLLAMEHGDLDQLLTTALNPLPANILSLGDNAFAEHVIGNAESYRSWLTASVDNNRLKELLPASEITKKANSLILAATDASSRTPGPEVTPNSDSMPE
jgi:hypothetical protein